MGTDVFAVIAATVVMFIIGAFWYMVPFAKIWGHMHGFDKLSEKEQKAAQSKMGPYYGIQIIITVIAAWMLLVLIKWLPGQSPYLVALVAWFGFTLPAQASSVVFGGTEPKFIMQKIAIMAGEALLHLLAAAFIIKWIIG